MKNENLTYTKTRLRQLVMLLSDLLTQCPNYSAFAGQFPRHFFIGTGFARVKSNNYSTLK